MLKHLRVLLALSPILFFLPGSLQAGSAKVEVEFSNKLGVNRRVTVDWIAPFNHPSIRETPFGKGGIKGKGGKTAEANDPLFGLAEKRGLRLVISLRFTKSVMPAGAQTVVVLADGTQYSGSLYNEPRLVTTDREVYWLSSMTSLTVINPEQPKPIDPAIPVWTLTFPKLAGKPLHIQTPRFCTAETLDKIAEFDSTSRLFAMSMDGEVHKGYATDFNRIEVERAGDKWKITLQAPQAQPVSGFLAENAWELHSQTLNGVSASLRSDAMTAGFLLTRGKQ